MTCAHGTEFCTSLEPCPACECAALRAALAAAEAERDVHKLAAETLHAELVREVGAREQAEARAERLAVDLRQTLQKAHGVSEYVERSLEADTAALTAEPAAEKSAPEKMRRLENIESVPGVVYPDDAVWLCSELRAAWEEIGRLGARPEPSGGLPITWPEVKP